MIAKPAYSRNKYLWWARVRGVFSCVQLSRSGNGQQSAQDTELLHAWLHSVRTRVTSQSGKPWGRRRRWRWNAQVAECLLLQSFTQKTSGSSCFPHHRQVRYPNMKGDKQLSPHDIIIKGHLTIGTTNKNLPFSDLSPFCHLDCTQKVFICFLFA